MGGEDEMGEGSGKINPFASKRNMLTRFNDGFYNLLDRPVTWFRENIVEPNQKPSNWYHMQLRRVPTIDQCYTDDAICEREAQLQFRRDMNVDAEIVGILRYRMDDCVREEYPDWEKCKPLKETYEQAAANWFCKYGDIGGKPNVRTAYMKQKHRMIWERRHGPVGTGMKKNEFAAEPCDH